MQSMSQSLVSTRILEQVDHQIGGCLIGNLPMGHQQRAGAGKKEGSRQTGQAFPLETFLRTWYAGSAGGQNDRIGIETQLENFADINESILSLPTTATRAIPSRV